MWLPQGGALKIENLQFTQYCSLYSLLMGVKEYNQIELAQKIHVSKN